MKVIPFPKPYQESYSDSRPVTCRPTRDSGLFSLLEWIDDNPLAVVLFVDQQPTPQLYVIANPWIIEHAVVIEVDQAMVDHFHISKVPQYRWFWSGQEIHYLVGAASQAEFLEINNAVCIAHQNERNRK